MQNFLSILDLDPDRIAKLLESAAKLKRERVKAREKEKLATVYNITLKLRRSALAGRIVFPILHPAAILRSAR